MLYSVVLLCGGGALCAGQHQAEEGEQAVEQQYFKAEVVARPQGHVDFQEVANDGREHGYDGHPGVAHPPAGEEAEGVEAQQGAVGEAGNVEEGVDKRLVVEGAEGHDDH